MRMVLSHIYSGSLLVGWAVFMHKTLTPRYPLWACMLVYVLALPPTYLFAYLIAVRLTFVRLFSVPCVFIALGFILYRSRPLFTLFVAFFPELCILLMDTTAVLVYPPLLAADGYELFWLDPISIPVSLTWLAIFSAALFTASTLLTKRQQSLTAAQWLVFSAFPVSQTISMSLLYRLYAQDLSGVSWPLPTAMILLYVVTDAALFRVISQTARKAELEAANRLLNIQLDNQLKHYEALARQYEDNRRIRHDIAHHVHTIQLLLENDRHDEAVDYAGEILRQQSHYSQLGQCQNPVVDAFLFSRIQEAERLHIPVDTDIVLPAELPIPNVDLVILFGNLMDNAIESCTGLEHPDIRLSAQLRRGYLSVTQSNPATERQEEKKRRIPELERGVGLHILEDLARKYDGTCTHEIADGRFSISVVLKLTKGGDALCS